MSKTYLIKMTSNSSHIRTEPKYDASGKNVVGWTQKNEQYTATDYRNGWYKISRKNSQGKSVTGWVYQGDKKQYVTLLKTNTPPTPSTDKAKSNTAEETENQPAVVNNSAQQQEALKPKVQRTVSVPAIQDIDDHAIAFTKDATPSLGKVYKPKSQFVFKDMADNNRKYTTPASYINNMKGSNFFKYYEVGKNGVYDEKFGDRYGDIRDALAYIREEQDIPGLHNRDEMFQNFNRYKLATPDTQASKVIPYIFFTKPALNMVDSNGKMTAMTLGDPLWESMYGDEKRNFFNLDSYYREDKHDFNCLLSNAAMSFQASDEVLRTVEHGETYTGWKMVYGRNTNESNTAGQFSISYVDDYNFNIYKMHKIWVEYINRVYRGEMPSAKAMEDTKIYNTFRENIYKKVLTYPCAVYYIVCGPDGESILYWSKYYGVFPINTPASVSSWTHGSPQGFPEFSINYVYSIKEDFHPVTLSEFNRHSSGDRIYRPIYNPDTLTNTPTFVGAPYIETQRDSNNKISFKLRFRDN